MPIPNLIPISRIEDYFTKNIGTYEGSKQFMCLIVARFDPPIVSEDVDWQPQKKWYAVLHKFDKEGNHLDTVSWYAGTSEEEGKTADAARAKVSEFIRDLGPVNFQDIAIKLFQVDVDGDIYGLQQVTKENEDDDDEVELMPGVAFFFPPWDGYYET